MHICAFDIRYFSKFVMNNRVQKAFVFVLLNTISKIKYTINYSNSWFTPASANLMYDMHIWAFDIRYLSKVVLID